jgi:2-oxoglutarate dehydrogenase E2 component (dihydrolipoamide succinyltransferase)
MDVKVPSVGESITEVTVGQWTVEDGAYVEMDDPICELESDKATFELNAEAAGVIFRKAEEGDTLEVGQVICTIDTEAKKPDDGTATEQKPGADRTADKAEAGAADEQQKRKEASNDKNGKAPEEPSRTGRTIDMVIPEVGESITEVTIGTWVKKDGDLVEMDDVVAEIESDKATFELTAEGTGVLHIKAEEGATVSVGALVCQIEEMRGVAREQDGHADAEQTGEARPAVDRALETDEGSYAVGHPSPAAAKILKEKNIDLADVQGTGMGGRITKEDALKAHQRQGVTAGSPREMPIAGPSAKQEPASADQRGERRKRMSTLRKTIANRLVAVKNETAMLTTFNEVNMQPIMDIRKKYKESFKEKYEVNLGFMSFFVRACCQALSEWPAVNSMLDGDEIIYHDHCDISIAVSTPKGLVVPVIRDAQLMGFDTIEKTIVELATRAREGKLSIEEMQGGTFTITNGGVFGSMLSTPIINAPQSAILGMHNIVERPVAADGEVVIRPVMYIALSYDHRVIDGRESVSFLVRVKELLEDPNRLLLGI